MPCGEIIIVGDEILTGEVLDTNSFELARELADAGFNITQITAVGDNKAAIQEVLATALKRADLIVLTGGLGPTWDDKTVKAVADALGLPLEINEQTYAHLKEHLERQGLQFLPGHEKMALLPKGSQPIGIAFHACGFKLLYQNKILYFLPGVPKQMRQILQEQVLPDLKGRFLHRSILFKKTLRVFGISESEVQAKIETVLSRFPEVKVSSLPHFPEVHLVLRTEKEAVLQQIVKEVKAILGNNIFGEDTETMAEVVGKLLLQKGYKLATAESLTGGLISHLITEVAGSSAYFERGVVTYSNEAKIEILGVPAEIIATYGAVSEPTARYMAEGIRRLAQSDIAVAVTGYAGPTGGPEAPVGTVFIALATQRRTKVSSYHFEGNREEVKIITAMTALDKIRRYLLS
ncbi:MAG: competence/damage-inducible protein A [Candidatus Desulfofervidaceae bacterium]|nr:competence/damage-inducible protein A [Candidatus Desulfofervidaceae bacterium]